MEDKHNLIKYFTYLFYKTNHGVIFTGHYKNTIFESKVFYIL
ncbi:hypothetical protein FM106_16455 [Brachybacterium faecium]|nr:hypothetical protein FM106_16455 [Brachybacterium faecium]